MAKLSFSGKFHKHYSISDLWVAYNLSGNRQTFYREQDAVDFSKSGSVVEYRGFTISPDLKIFKNGKQMFDAIWQRCETLQQAQLIIDTSIACKIEQTNYETFQLEKYGNVVGSLETTPEGELFESGVDELNRLADYIERQSEKELYTKEY